MDIKEIMKRLNHRYPFLLVDRVLEIVDNKSIIGYKNITFNEPYFTGHFPENPIFPGVLIIESMAQLGGLMFTGKGMGYLVGVDKAKFIKFVVPGDQLRTEANLIQLIGNYAKVELEGSVDGTIVAKAQVTYYFE